MLLGREGVGGRAGREKRTVLLGAATPEMLDSLRALPVVAAFMDIMPPADSFGGIPVLGPLAESRTKLGAALEELNADCVLWAAAPANRALARAVLEQAVDAGARVYVLVPGERPQMRLLSLDDLIARPSAPAERTMMASAVEGRRILITGGAGSIGAELARKIAALRPARLVVADIAELSIFNIGHDPAFAGVAFESIVADVVDPAEVAQIFEAERPEIVFHAAAMKHVPIVEKHACRAAKTNVLGSRNVSDACAKYGAHLIFLSTDKAVRPKGVMGATKALAGRYCRALDAANAGEDAPRQIVVRLGNVLGSAGSVAPLFERKIAEGMPIQVTHAKAERFFVTHEQAAECLLLTAAMALKPGSTRGAAYMLDMGEAIPIVELAHDVVRLAGLRPDLDVPIEFTGLRPGEKLTEELVSNDETLHPTDVASVHAVTAELLPLATLKAHMDAVIEHAKAGDAAAVKRALIAAVAPRRARPRRQAV